MATNYGAPPIVTRGLIWKVDAANNIKNINAAGSNSIIGNTSNVGFSGSLEGGMSRVTSQPQYWEFDGDNDYIQFAANNSIGGGDIISLYGKTTATFEFWIAPEYNGDTYQRVISKSYTGGGGVGGYALMLNGKNFLLYIDNGSGSAVGTIDYTTSASAGQWIHIVVKRDGNSYSIYENDILKNTNTVSATFVNTASGLRIGSWNHTSGREYKGKLAVAGIHDVALSRAEITQNYNALKERFL